MKGHRRHQQALSIYRLLVLEYRDIRAFSTLPSAITKESGPLRRSSSQ